MKTEGLSSAARVRDLRAQVSMGIKYIRYDVIVDSSTETDDQS